MYNDICICIEYLKDRRTNLLRPVAVLVYGQAHVTMYLTREMLAEASCHVMIFIFFLWTNWLNY